MTREEANRLIDAYGLAVAEMVRWAAALSDKPYEQVRDEHDRAIAALRDVLTNPTNGA